MGYCCYCRTERGRIDGAARPTTKRRGFCCFASAAGFDDPGDDYDGRGRPWSETAGERWNSTRAHFSVSSSTSAAAARACHARTHARSTGRTHPLCNSRTYTYTHTLAHRTQPIRLIYISMRVCVCVWTGKIGVCPPCEYRFLE